MKKVILVRRKKHRSDRCMHPQASCRRLVEVRAQTLRDSGHDSSSLQWPGRSMALARRIASGTGDEVEGESALMEWLLLSLVRPACILEGDSLSSLRPTAQVPSRAVVCMVAASVDVGRGRSRETVDG